MRFWVPAISMFFIFIACTTVLADIDELQKVGNRLQKCEEKWCVSVAQPPSTWPSPLKSDSILMEEHPAIEINIPAGFIRIRRTGYLLMFTYPHNKILFLEEISKEAFPKLLENTKNTKMTMADAAHATFTKTTKDKVPDCPDDKKFWYWAMFFKMVFFENGSPVFSSKKDSLTAYYFSEKRNGGPVINEAAIINDNSPDYILKLKSANMSYEEFRSIIGTIKEAKAMKP